MATADKLRRMKDYTKGLVDALTDRIELEDPSSTPDPKLAERLRDLRTAAIKAHEVADSPVKIGVVGEYSSGKTSMLSALIGRADSDALPIKEVATTGNVTALHFTPIDQLQTTQVGPFTVEFLMRDEVAATFAHMLQEAAQRADLANLPDEMVEQVGSMDPTERDFVDQIERWGENAWKQSDNPGLRFLIRELLTFARSYASCGGALCGNKIIVDAEVAEDGLTLADPETDMKAMPFSKLTPAPEYMAQIPQRITADQLQGAFSLIKRVRVDVKLSRDIWDLVNFTGDNEFVLLDFPGLGAAFSGVRDTYLCMSELAHVQTILVLLNGRNPSSGGCAPIVNEMQRSRKGQDIKDCILVAVGRFDDIPSVELPLDNVIKAGKEAGGEVFDDDDVFDRIDVLQNLVAVAQSFTSDKSRVAFISPVISLHDAEDKWPDIEVSDGLFKKQMEKIIPSAEKMRDKWREAATTINDSGTLKTWLDAFAEDGGITRLRTLIEDHVSAHGVRQLVEHAEKEVRNVTRMHSAIIEEFGLAEEDGGTSIATDVVRKTLDSIARKYSDFKVKYCEMAPPLEFQHDGEKQLVSSAVEEDVVYRVFSWVEWISLLDRVDDGYVGQAMNAAAEDSLIDLSNYNEGLPDQAEDFYDRFTDTVQRCEEYAKDCVRRAIEELLVEMEEDLQAIRQPLQKIIENADIKKSAIAALESEGEKYFEVLRAASYPKRFEKKLHTICGVMQEKDETMDWDRLARVQRLFPMPRPDESHDKGQAFAWGDLGSVSKDLLPARYARHQVQIQRIRETLVAAAVRHLVREVNEANERMQKVLSDTFAVIHANLTNAARTDKFVRCLADPDSVPGAQPSSLQKIALQVASIAKPF